MNNIEILAVWTFPAWHSDKKTIISIDNLYIMNDKFIIKDNGHKRFYPPFVCNLSYSDICDLHLAYLTTQNIYSSCHYLFLLLTVLPESASG